MVELRGLPPMNAFCRWALPDTCGLEFRNPLPLKALVAWVREHQSMSLLKRGAQDAA